MNKRTALYLYLSSLLVALTLAAACTSTPAPESTPITLPTVPPTQEPKSLSASEMAAVNEFAEQQQAIGVEWDELRTDFDQWRTTLTSCDESAVQNALRGFVADFNSVTEQTRDLPRASATREFSEILIDAAEAEAVALRQLHDRWQPNNPSLFETIEQRRAEAGRAQREVQDLIADTQEKLEEAADPERLRAIEQFSLSLESILDDWDELHDDYFALLQVSAGLDHLEVLARLDVLTEQLNAILKSIDILPATDTTKEMVDLLEDAAKSERRALARAHSSVVQAVKEKAEKEDDEEDATPVPEESEEAVAQLHELLEQVTEDSQAAQRSVELTMDEALDGNAEEDLKDVQEFTTEFEAVLPAWDAFHEQYDEWLRTEGGCDRTEVIEALGQFNIRMTEIGRQVKELPQSGYLLPMYSLLVEAVEREEGAIRALRNSWQPFTVDAFIAAEKERDNADRLRREAGIALEELLNRN